MPANIAPQRHKVTVGEVPNIAIDCQGLLETGEIIASITSILEVVTSDLTIDNKAINSAALTINGVTAAIGKALLCRISGVLAGKQYLVQSKFVTNSTPAATRICDIWLVGVEA